MHERDTVDTMKATISISTDLQRIFDTGGVETPQALYHLRVHGPGCEELLFSTPDLSTNSTD
jgi:hypothetical protein